MLRIITKMRRQYAVWWAKTGQDQYGRATFAEPVEIRCRWDDSGSEYRNDAGQLTVGEATVYADRVIGVGDVLLKGEMESDVEMDPTGLELAQMVQKFDEIPTLKADQFLYIAHMSRTGGPKVGS